MSDDSRSSGSPFAVGDVNEAGSRGYTRRLMDAVPDIMYVVDETPALVDWNEAALEVTGYDDGELAERGVEAFFPSEVYPRVAESIREAFETGQARIEAPLLTKSGEQILYEFHSSRTRNPEGEPVIVGTGRDISERRSLEVDLEEARSVSEERADELEAANERLEQLLEHTPALIYTVEPEPPYDLTWLCRNTSHVLGVEADQVLGESRSWLDHVHPDDRTRIEASFEELAGDAETPTQEYEYRVKVDGEYRWLLETARGIPGDGGEVSKIVASSIDITERKQVQRELEESEARFREITEHLDAVVWLSDPDKDEMLYVSPAYEEVWGRSVESLYQEPTSFIEAIHPDDREEVVEQLPGQVDGDYDVEYRIVQPDGEVRWVHDEAFPIEDEHGDVVRIAGLARDITEQIQAEREREQSEEVLRQIAENLDAAVWLTETDPDGVEDADVLYLSPQFEEMFDIPRERIQEDPMVFLERVHPDDVERIQAETEAITPDDPRFEMEYRIQLDDGSVRHMRTEGVPIETPEGQRPRLAGISQDVTKVRETERELAERQAHLENMLEVSPAVIFALDEEGRFTLSEGRPLEDLGLEPGEVVGLDAREVYADHPEIRESVDRALSGETVENLVEVQGLWFESRYEPMLDDEGEVVGVVGISIDVTEAVEAQQEIERERHRYEQLLSTAPNCIVQIDIDGRFTYANDRAEEVLGLEPAEVTERTYNDPEWEIRDLDGNEIPDEELPFRQVRDGGQVVRDERHTIRWPDGTERILSVHGAPIFDEDGEVESTVFALVDITERLEHQEALRRERDLRAQLFTDSIDPVMTVEFTPETPVIRDANEAFLETFGYDTEEVLDRNATDLLVPEGGLAKHWDLAQRLEDGEAIEAEAERKTAEGPKGFLIQAVPIETESPNPVAYVWYSDLSKVRRLEREEKLKARMLDEIDQAVIVTDGDTRVEYWNAHAEEAFGWSAEEVEGEPLGSLLVPDTDEARDLSEEMWETLTRGDTWSGECQVQRKDGTTFPAIVADSPILDEDGNLERVIRVAYDISDIRQTQRELARTSNRLEARNRELRELSQAAAHTFRTPIWDTTRYLDLLERETGDKLDEDEEEYIQTALDGAHRLHDLVESLQEYLDASTREVGVAYSDAGEVVDSVLNAMGDTVEESSATIDVEEPAPRLAIDEESLAEALKHLIENAIVFSGEEPPEIEVSFEREGSMWVVTVRDEGVGIDPDYHERVFHPFRTLHSHVEGGGPGLGLALCRGIVEAHGGHIWLNSEPGEGTTVYMTLPDADSPPRRFQTRESLENGGDPDVFDDDIDLFEE